MNRTIAEFSSSDIPDFTQRMLNWANRFNIFLFLDSHHYADPLSREEWVLAAGAVNSFCPTTHILDQLKTFLAENPDWIFGHFNYDLKNEIESLGSHHPDPVGFPEVYLFRPEVVIRKTGQGVQISTLGLSPEDVYAAILATEAVAAGGTHAIGPLQSRISKADYLLTVEKLRQHILRGDCYLINFCQEFFAEHAVVDPAALYLQLSRVSPAPFGGFYKLEDKYLLCASPERFVCRRQDRLVSQPIKGTARRNPGNPAADRQLKAELAGSAKERSENVMVVDLVRNDLSRVCRKGSVRVDELCGLYSFPQVHQMISTVSGQLAPGKDLSDVLRACFPMGSMTGAPKKRVMELTETYERSKRGLYSGAIGYIAPGGDFDFNVVIRSILYNQASGYLSYQVGGAITFYSDPEKEYEECLVKAQAIKKVLG